MRLPSSAFLVSSLLGLASCGGGGGGGSSPSPPPSTSAPPVIVYLSSDTALMPDGYGPTLKWRTSGTAGTACTASGGWSGAKAISGTETLPAITQTTTYSITCTEDRAQTGSASVTIVHASALPPEPTASKVWSEENVTSLDYARLPYGTRFSVWSEAKGLIYALTTADSPTAPNSLLAINPATLAVQVLPLGGPSWSIDLTSDQQFLYIGMTYGGGFKRVRTSDLAIDLEVPVGGPTTSIQRVVASPVNPHTIAVLASNVPNDHTGTGLYIYDDATQRPAKLDGDLQISPTEWYINFGLIDVDWSADGSKVYAMGLSPTAGLFDVDVDAQGAHFNRHRGWPTASPGDIFDGRYYSSDGRIFNMTGPLHLEARIPDWYFATPFRLPVPGRGKIFSVGTNLDGRFEDGTRIIAFDYEKYTYIDAIAFRAAANFVGGITTPFGTDGLYIGGPTESIVAHGSFAAAGGAPPASSATLPLLASGVERNPSSDRLEFRIAQVGAMSVTSNPCGKLYLTTGMNSWVRPGSVLEVDPDNLTITRSANVGRGPDQVVASDDCSTLYVGSLDSSSVARVRAADLVTTDVLPIGGEDLSRARTMTVAPGQAQTVAIALQDIERTLCSGTDQGVLIYDGTTPRPSYTAASFFGIKSIVFGATPSILYGEDFDDVYAFDVDAGGLSNRRVVMPRLSTQADYDMGRDLYFDPVASRLFNSYGDVYDAAANAQMPKLVMDYPNYLVGCGAAGQTRVTDPTTGKLFWVSSGLRQDFLGVTVYARNGLTKLGAVEFGLHDELGSLGFPSSVARLPNNRLAFVTTYGYLIVVQGALLAP